MKHAAMTALAGMLLFGSATQMARSAEASGKEVFEHYCVHCHGAGNDQPGTLQLGRTRGKDKAVLTERTDLLPDYVRLVVRGGLRAMPSFAPSDLTDAKLSVLARYLGKAIIP